MIVTKNNYPKLYKNLGQNGMFVMRNIERTRSKSLNSWGNAIDLMIDGIEDVKWNDKAFYGLALMAPIFNEHGWFWGGAFRDKEKEKGVYWSNEDAMHFEVSKEKFLEWQRAGMFGPISKHRLETISPAALTPVNTASSLPSLDIRKGDKGPCVVLLQNTLRVQNYNIRADGFFGTKTELALIDFQRKHGLIPNGILGAKTALHLSLSSFAGR